MKRTLMILPMLGVLAAVQPAAADRGRPHRPSFAEIDVDANGSVTEEEFLAPLLAHASERFAVIDADDDGVITEVEFEAAPFPRRRHKSAE